VFWIVQTIADVSFLVLFSYDTVERKAEAGADTVELFLKNGPGSKETIQCCLKIYPVNIR